MKRLNQSDDELAWPNTDDHKGAINAIIRLQDTYQLAASQVRLGVFKSSKSFRQLNGDMKYIKQL